MSANFIFRHIFCFKIKLGFLLNYRKALKGKVADKIWMSLLSFGFSNQPQIKYNYSLNLSLKGRNPNLGLVKYYQNNLWIKVSKGLPPQSCCWQSKEPIKRTNWLSSYAADKMTLIKKSVCFYSKFFKKELDKGDKCGLYRLFDLLIMFIFCRMWNKFATVCLKW